MARLLAIDYGGKRCGIAVSDPSQIIATGLTTVATTELVAFLKKYFVQEDVEQVIIGFPKNLNNEATHATALVEQFITLYNNTFYIPITTIDERLSSKMAKQSIVQSVAKKKDRQNKALVDEVSATILLQDYMQGL
jgi:putative holliday junction resolvase